MKIFIEAHTILKNRSGVGWFAHGLTRGLQQIVPPEAPINLITHPREPIDIDDLLTDPRTVERPIDWMPARLYHSLKFRNLMPPVDLAYGNGTYIFPNFIRWPLAKAPSVIVVHDLTMFDVPDYSSPKNLEFMTRHLPTSIARADLIVAVSNHAKQTLCDKFKVDPAKVIVSHLAAEPTLYYRRSDEEIARAKAKYGIFGPYMLFVSTLEPRKNVENLVKAYQKLPQKIKGTYSLVLVGGRGWRDEPIREAITNARMQGDRVVLPGYVDTEDMAALYSGATAFMFPSHYEGFGLPVLEAMRCGTPVLTADNTALPESAGDAALYIDANNFTQLKDGMHELLTNDKLRKDLVKKGYKQAESFSWEKCAGTIFAAMQDHKLI